MIPFARYARGLARDGDLVTIDDRDDTPADVIAAEALRASGPACRFERVDGVDLASGVFSGPDQMQRRPAGPWSRLSLGLGLDHEATLVDLLETIADPGRLRQTRSRPTLARQRRERTRTCGTCSSHRVAMTRGRP